MTGRSGPIPRWTPGLDKVRQLQRGCGSRPSDPGAPLPCLMDRIWRGDVLQEAWRRVKRMRRCGRRWSDARGGEQYGVERLLQELGVALRQARIVRSRCCGGTSQGRGRQRPSASDDERPSGQMAATLVLEPFSRRISGSSYGFRPKRSATQALEVLRVQARAGGNQCWSGHPRLLRSIDQQRLLALVSATRLGPTGAEAAAAVARRRGDGGRAVDAHDGGTAQGGVISPLLSNVYLHVLDRVWEDRCAHGTLVR